MTIKLNLQEKLVAHWTMNRRDKNGQTTTDSGGYQYHGTCNEPTQNYFDDVETWHPDLELLGSVDGFNDVAKADATSNSGFEDIFTDRFNTSDFSNSGSGYYVYLAFAAKWNSIPVFGKNGTWLKQPTPDPNKYQLYILRNDGQNSRNEYFRIYYKNSDSTSVGRIADPFVWTQEDEDDTARIIGDNDNRTVEPYTYSPVGDAMNFVNAADKEVAINQTPEFGSDSFAISFWLKGDFSSVPESYPRVFNNFWGRGTG
jgi:hypothetical protein